MFFLTSSTNVIFKILVLKEPKTKEPTKEGITIVFFFFFIYKCKGRKYYSGMYKCPILQIDARKADNLVLFNVASQLVFLMGQWTFILGVISFLFS